MTRKTDSFDVIAQLAALRRYALSLVRNADEAEDLVQDALTRAYERQASFRTGSNLRNWLLSIVHNVHVDRLRRRRSLERRHEAAAEIADHAVAPSQDHSVRLGQLRGAFFALPEDQREALHLVAIEELSYREAADALAIPVGTLMSRIARARARLRALEQDLPAGTTPHLRLVGGNGDDQQ
ncbi:sigma-70 family RNA polymerase sigma factor [Rhizobium sp. TRM95111]|uniref:sigma-70 family RNA polymerase sigma factor n=1 Tax=Rhizobium alarense TaxID=2846851 RepID=UPI001F444540|nr:sigma-70 family RNA polymerase sigma factor [Rhizobium alarense]MCF3641209.1 sigma-70 family RNA polymerase sigma factor [Rhizobium alarense]